MSNSMFLHSFLIFFFFISFASSSSSSFNKTTHKCSAEQSLALLQFKQNLSSINFSIDDPSYSPCQDWLGSGYYPIMMNWDSSTDCCTWNGVSCNHFTGDVIGLDLSCGMLRGTIHPNTTLFHLPHLQRLNLAYNFFYPSYLPPEIGRFANSLTHLNISYCFLTGQIPSDISLLPKLVSLDLSSNAFDSPLEPHVFYNLLRNSTVLEELSLGRVNISWVLPTYLTISSSLKLLYLGSTGLQGKLPDNIFNLPYLEKLDLSNNYYLTGPLPKVNLSSSLKLLDLRWTSLQGKLPDNIFNLPYLEELDLSDNYYLTGPLPKVNISSSLKLLDLRSTSLQGKLPDNIFNLPYLEQLDLSYNYYLTGPLPKVNMTIDIPLKWLDLSYIDLSGETPDSIGHLKSLNTLRLVECSFRGSLPKFLGNLRQLTALYLSSNMLNGTLPSWLFTLPSLDTIYLDDNMFSGNVPVELFALRSLKELSLGSNQLVGKIEVLDEGSISQSFQQLTNLTYLDLSFNNFRGVLELDTLLSSLTNLESLVLSYSGLSVVTNNATHYVNPNFFQLGLAFCKLIVFPESLRAMKNIQYLDLSSNELHGHIPNWAGGIGGNQLWFLNLSHNLITGLQQFQSDGLQELYLQSNLIQGPFPPSICNMSNLNVLDMSNNSFGGVIPQCLGNISDLFIINLANNHFHGTIPNVFEDCGELKGLILNGNQFEGEVPTSLSKCQGLIVLDLGNNHLNGTFPGWLGGLPYLQVLLLKSNKLHGPIESSSMIELPFPSLRVLDLSHNVFVGHLPRKYFQNFKAMKNVVKKGTEPEYVIIYNTYYSVTIEVKDLPLLFPKLFEDYTIVDLSNNRFEGEIPDVIGSLNSLIGLNLSHNSLTGRIPHALGNLSEIESLDLSWNQLTGEIPQSLVDITTLAVLNLSQNHLVGRIPEGTQFSTFETSFGGNPELCGLPLPKKCEHPQEPQLEADGDTESGFTWKVVKLGYGCGTLLGLVMGFLMLSTGRPRWFNAIADAGEVMIQRRRNKRRYVYIGK